MDTADADALIQVNTILKQKLVLKTNLNDELDENECKYRPCDVFAHCTNTLGSFFCTCFPGYKGDGFSCTGNDFYYIFKKKTGIS